MWCGKLDNMGLKHLITAAKREAVVTEVVDSGANLKRLPLAKDGKFYRHKRKKKCTVN